MCIDPAAGTAENFGPELGDSSASYAARGVLGKDGKIYFAPYDADRVVCVDPTNDSAELLGPEMSGETKYAAGGVLAPNGSI
mmetsp:Transcript_32332/g.65327  ORF Transcript_32332/g.65327 Transcript_32332/m.65327 type:complete len:82 (-) Transcript_32332:29-274(-)